MAPRGSQPAAEPRHAPGTRPPTARSLGGNGGRHARDPRSRAGSPSRAARPEPDRPSGPFAWRKSAISAMRDPRHVDDLAVGRSVRMVRIRKRMRQADLAEAAHVSRATISRIERGHLERLQLGTIRSVCAAVDARLLLDPRWEGADLDRLVGARHSAMHESVARYFLEHPEWITAPEMTFSEFGERGSIDILLWHAATRSLLVIELKTEIVDVQDMVAVLDRKVRLAAKVARDRGWQAATVSVWLVIAHSSTNRRRVAAHAAMLRSAFPDDGRRIAAWLRRPTERVAAMSFLSSAPGKNPGSGFAPVGRVRRAAPRSGAAAARRSAPPRLIVRPPRGRYTADAQIATAPGAYAPRAPHGRPRRAPAGREPRNCRRDPLLRARGERLTRGRSGEVPGDT